MPYEPDIGAEIDIPEPPAFPIRCLAICACVRDSSDLATARQDCEECDGTGQVEDVQPEPGLPVAPERWP